MILSNMKIIGLTGGIGTGKSTVSAYLKEKGCVILDADKMSRQLTAPGGAALPEIRKTFGDEVFFEDGTLDRKKLGSIVFNDKEKLKSLEKLTTEKVVEQTVDGLVRLRKADYSGIVIIDAPLLFECNMQELAQESWLVTTDLEVRIERIMKRDGLDRQSILDRINNQMSDVEKRAIADYVIDNSGSLENLYRQIEHLIERVADDEQ